MIRSRYNVALQKETQSRLLLDDRNEVADDVRKTRIENVSMAESIFGKEFDVKSHDATIRNLEIHFEEDRRKAAIRFESKKKMAAERERKKKKAKTLVPKLARKIKKILIKKECVSTKAIIDKFEPLCRKHFFTKEHFRDALRSAGKLENGFWRTKGTKVD